MALFSPLSAPHFVATKSEEEIARRLREDEALINAGKPCSWVAWHLSGYDTGKEIAIAAHLAPIPGLSHDIKSVIYENLLRKIKRYLSREQMCRTMGGATPGREVAQKPLHPSELSIALKVLINLAEASTIQRDTSAEIILSFLEQQVASEDPTKPPLENEVFVDEIISSNIPKPPHIPRKRQCYICRITLVNPHPSQPSMCIPCGAFNLSSSQLSKPPKFSLPPTFTALVTGARINLGYHTALRLLRCGARVLVTTRYQHDAVARYLGENDSAEWRERLKIVGADFRCAADAFALVNETKRCLRAWADGGEAKLHALINNAAQTLTDSVEKEEGAVKREKTLEEGIKSHQFLIDGAYRARVRGGALPMTLEDTKKSAVHREGVQGNVGIAGAVKAFHVPKGAATAEVEPYSKSSWVQSLSEIPYEDLISAHAVNTFVPLILCRELLPIMGCTNSPTSSTSSTPSDPSSTVPQNLLIKPQGYIINVSSREGIFEDRTSSAIKKGKHVHTNISKAALNMITETEAAVAWRSRRVAMNTVDPGYMSAAPEYEEAFGGVRPIGWEDGAGRVLWPLAVSEMESHVVWGRFLKHYGAVTVDPGAGR